MGNFQNLCEHDVPEDYGLNMGSERMTRRQRTGKSIFRYKGFRELVRCAEYLQEVGAATSHELLNNVRYKNGKRLNQSARILSARLQRHRSFKGTRDTRNNSNPTIWTLQNDDIFDEAPPTYPVRNKE